MKIYISGKITGNPNYKKQFRKVEKILYIKGYETVNPAELLDYLPKDTPQDIFMRESIILLEDCDAIYLQNNWVTSKGAKQERDYAIDHNYLILSEDIK